MFPVLVEPIDGRFQASVPGAPALRADGETKDDAIAALRAELEDRYARGELVWLDIPRVGITDLPDRHRDDPYLREICEEAYRQRDAQKAAEFPE